jgi:hypothetical protein
MAETDPEELADRLEREADDMERASERLKRETEDVAQDWQRKRSDPGVPGQELLTAERDGHDLLDAAGFARRCFPRGGGGNETGWMDRRSLISPFLRQLGGDPFGLGRAAQSVRSERLVARLRHPTRPASARPGQAGARGGVPAQGGG